MSDVFTRLALSLADRYTVVRELGAGGMATVYLALDIKHERDVAIKVLHPDLGAALGVDRFLSEIKTTAKLQHPHVLPLLDSGAADGLLYYVMPFVRGETLRALLEREKQLPIDDAVRTAREVASALDHAYKQGIIHRDIKPENILLQDGAAVVADFGIALALESAGGARMTQTGLSLGTPQYMSPEQALGERTIDARSDIYALGAVTYEMLAGQPPFTGPVAQSVIRQHMIAEPPNLTDMRGAVPAGVSMVVRRALGKNPADRQPSAKVFAAELAEALQTSTMSHPNAALQSVSRVTPRVQRRVQRRVLVTGAIALLLAVGAFAMRDRLWRRSSSDADKLTRLVVLPFENIGKAEDAYFADGVTEEIASRLGQSPGVAVIGRATALQYKGSTTSLSKIGSELDVQYALTGTVR